MCFSMRKTLFLLMVAAAAVLPPGEVWAQRTVKVSPDYQNPNYRAYGDADGDGVKEKLHKEITDDGLLMWLKPDGTVLRTIEGSEDARSAVADSYGTYVLIDDFNNDGKADVLFPVHPRLSDGRLDINNVSGLVMAYSDGDGYELRDLGDGIPLVGEFTNAVVADFNRDGRKDIFLFEPVSGGTAKYQPVTLMQMADGSFSRQPLNVVTERDEIEKAMFSDGGNGSFTVNNTNFTGVAGLESGASYDEIPRMEAVDINMDGYPDLIDPDGNTFLSLPDGRYYSASIAGSVTLCDLNSDGAKDVVIFDSKTGDVTLNLSDGKGSYSRQTIFSNTNITAVACRDLDGDKLSDILLMADTPRGQQYAYLVFFRN